MPPGGPLIGEATIGLGLDDSGLQAELRRAEAQLEAAMRRIGREKAEVTIGADLKQLKKDLKEAEAEVKVWEAKVAAAETRGQTRYRQQQLQRRRLERDSRSEAVKTATAAADAYNLETKALRLQEKELQAVERYEQRVARARASSTKEAEKAAKSAEKNVTTMDQWVRSITQMTVRLGPFTAKVNQLTRVMLLLGPAIMGIVGGLGALAGALGAGLIGALGVSAAALTGLSLAAGGLALTFKPLAKQFKEIRQLSDAHAKAVLKYGQSSKQAKTAQEQLNKALQGVSPASRQAFRDLGSLSTRWNKLTASTRTALLDTMAKGLKTVEGLMPGFARRTNDTAAVVERGFDRMFAKLHPTGRQRGLNEILGVQSTGSVLDQLFGNFNQALPHLISGVTSLGDAFLRVVAVFSGGPLHSISLAFASWAKSIDQLTMNGPKLRSFVDQTNSSFRSLVSFAGAATRVLIAFFRAGSGTGTSIIQHMADSLNHLADRMNSVAGQRGLTRFFQQASQTAGHLFAVIGPLVNLFYHFSTVMRPITNIMLQVAAALAKVADAIVRLHVVQPYLQALFAGLLVKSLATKTAELLAFVGALRKVAPAVEAAAGAGAAKGVVGKAMPSIGVTAAEGAAGAGAAGVAGRFLPKIGEAAGLRVAGPIGIGVTVAQLLNSSPKLDKLTESLDRFNDAPRGSKRFDQLVALEKQLRAAVKAGDPAKLNSIAKQIDHVAGSAKGLNATNFKHLADGIRDFAQAQLWRKAQQEVNQTKGSFADLASSGRLSMVEIQRTVQVNIMRIAGDLGSGSKQGKAALADNFFQAAGAVKAAMDASGRTTKAGIQLINQYLADAFQELGFSRAQARNLVKVKNNPALTQGPGALAPGPTGGLRPHATGGLINEGRPSGDSVPSLLERGEYVLNREAVKAMGLDTLDTINYHAAPRFQKGGGVGGGLKPGIASAVKSVLGHFPGLSVTSTTGGTHAAGSYHYLGEAADIAGAPALMNRAAAWIGSTIGGSLAEGIHNPNLSIKFGKRVAPSYWGASTWAGHANHIHLAVVGALKAAGLSSAQIKRVVVQGGGAVGSLIQGGLDGLRAGANQQLDAVMGATNPGAESGSGAPVLGGKGHFGKGQLKKLWVEAGGSKNVANLMAAIALAESGGDPTAHNKSGASGLWQILGLPFPGNVWDPLTNARMAVSKYKSQGLGAWTTYTDGSFLKYLQRGGLARLRKGGSPFHIPKAVRYGAVDESALSTRVDKAASAYNKAKGSSQSLQGKLQTAREDLTTAKTPATKRKYRQRIASDQRQLTAARGSLPKLYRRWQFLHAELGALHRTNTKIGRLDTLQQTDATLMQNAAKTNQPGAYKRAKKDRTAVLKQLRTMYKRALRYAKDPNVKADLQSKLAGVNSDLIDTSQDTIDVSLDDYIQGTGKSGTLARLQEAQALAGLTDTTADDVTADQGLVGFYQGILTSAQKHHAPVSVITAAAQALSGAKSDLAGLTDTGSAGLSPDQQAVSDQNTNLGAILARNRALVAAYNSVALGGTDLGITGLPSIGGSLAGSFGGAAPVVVNINALHPGDPAVLRAVGDAAAAGFGFQGGTPSPRLNLGY